MDWYLLQGFVNIAIVIVNQISWIVMYSKLSYLSMIVGCSLCVCIIMTRTNVYAVCSDEGLGGGRKLEKDIG